MIVHSLHVMLDEQWSSPRSDEMSFIDISNETASNKTIVRWESACSSTVNESYMYKGTSVM